MAVEAEQRKEQKPGRGNVGEWGEDDHLLKEVNEAQGRVNEEVGFERHSTVLWACDVPLDEPGGTRRGSGTGSISVYTVNLYHCAVQLWWQGGLWCGMVHCE